MFFLGLILGGYFMPALIDGFAIWHAEGEAEDTPTTFERLTTAALGGLAWPLATVRAEPED